ncbi:hypothetical protein VTK73DRAFT_9037 [Phialemonium thermophilum]|uniref:CN hydrolase domain-containing protein n=1 Tax=Phialemonium thermophilum TaxID=223376 RepID=A0ABR3XMG5_9PEZI
MKIGCLQFAPQVGDVENNLNRADAVLSRVDPQELDDLDLLVLPEMAFSGYNFRSLQEISPFLEPSGSGVSSLWARTTALKHDCAVVVGYPERVDVTDKWPTGPEYYNSLIMVSGDGETIVNYRKSFLYYTDETWALEGPGFYEGDIEGFGKVAMGICMDINPYKFQTPWHAFEFAFHILEVNANLVILSMAWLTLADATEFSQLPQDPDMETLTYWVQRLEPVIRAERSEEIIVVFANRCGTEGNAVYSGTSAVLGIKDGEVSVYGLLGRGTKELLVVDTDLTPFAKLVSRPEQEGQAGEPSQAEETNHDLNSTSSNPSPAAAAHSRSQQPRSPHNILPPMPEDIGTDMGDCCFSPDDSAAETAYGSEAPSRDQLSRSRQPAITDPDMDQEDSYKDRFLADDFWLPGKLGGHVAVRQDISSLAQGYADNWAASVPLDGPEPRDHDFYIARETRYGGTESPILATPTFPSPTLASIRPKLAIATNPEVPLGIAEVGNVPINVQPGSYSTGRGLFTPPITPFDGGLRPLVSRDFTAAMPALLQTPEDEALLWPIRMNEPELTSIQVVSRSDVDCSRQGSVQPLQEYYASSSNHGHTQGAGECSTTPSATVGDGHIMQGDTDTASGRHLKTLSQQELGGLSSASPEENSRCRRIPEPALRQAAPEYSVPDGETAFPLFKSVPAEPQSRHNQQSFSGKTDSVECEDTRGRDRRRRMRKSKSISGPALRQAVWDSLPPPLPQIPKQFLEEENGEANGDDSSRPLGAPEQFPTIGRAVAGTVVPISTPSMTSHGSQLSGKAETKEARREKSSRWEGLKNSLSIRQRSSSVSFILPSRSKDVEQKSPRSI